MPKITEMVAADKNLSTLLRGVKAAGMETALNQEGPFTVFAPSESAFGKLPQGELPFLLLPTRRGGLGLVLRWAAGYSHQVISDTSA